MCTRVQSRWLKKAGVFQGPGPYPFLFSMYVSALLTGTSFRLFKRADIIALGWTADGSENFHSSSRNLLLV